MLSLKVLLVSQDKTTAMRFMQDMSVNEVCKQIREKTGEGGADHGLFQPPNMGAPGRWLRADRTLQYYDLSSGDEVHYKKKHRPIKIRLMDDSLKKMLIDDSQTVIEIVEAIAEKMEIRDGEEYSLQVNGKWLNPTLSLHENAVDEDAEICLKKKFFFSDKNIDRSDPIQLHLLYVQQKDAVVSGMLPTLKDEAVQLAALQCQAAYGNYNAAVHKPGYLDLKDYLAPEWNKRKELEKDIYTYQKKLVGTTELNAKYRYVQLCRSLKTYGITCYQVKIRSKNSKKKTDPYLLGITRDAILKMDPDTKEVVQKWQLTQLRRWAASDKTFTLDFGDYEDDYLSLMTNEGEAISQLIAGYIDIILKRRKDQGRTEAEDDSVLAMEESIAPIRAAVVHSTTTSLGLGAFDPNAAREQMLSPGMMLPGMMGMGGPNPLGGKGAQAYANKQGIGGQSIPITDLASALEATNLMLSEIATPGSATLDPGDIPPEEWRRQLAAHAAAIAKQTEELMMQANGQNPDRAALDAISRTLGQNLADMLNAARHAAHSNEDDISLLQGAKAVSQAIANVLASVKDIADNPQNEPARQALRNGAAALMAAQLFLASAQQGVITDEATQDLILASARAVANAAGEMVGLTYNASRGVHEPVKRQELMTLSKSLGAATGNVNNVAAGCAPGMGNYDVRAKFIDMANGLRSQAGILTGKYNASVTDPSYLEKMAAAAANVNDAIAQLISATETAGGPESNPRDFVPAGSALANHVSQLLHAKAHPTIIAQNAKGVQESTALIIKAAKMLVPVLAADERQQILASAKALAEATGRLIPSSKKAASSPNDAAAQRQMEADARLVGSAVTVLIAQGGRHAALMHLRHVAKKAAAEMTTLIASSRACLNSFNPTDDDVRSALIKTSHEAHLGVVELVGRIKASANAPGDKRLAEELYDACRSQTIASFAMISTAKRGGLKLSDQAKKTELKESSEAAASAMNALVRAVREVDEAGQNPEVTGTLDVLSSLRSDLDSALALADAGFLSVPGATRDGAMDLMVLAARQMNESSDRARQAAYDQDVPGMSTAAQNQQAATTTMVQAAKEYAGSVKDKSTQKKVLTAAKQALDDAGSTLKAAGKVSQEPNDQKLCGELEDAHAAEATSVAAVLNAARGMNANELDEALASIQRDGTALAAGQGTGGDYGLFADMLEAALKTVSAATGNVVSAAKLNPKGLGTAAKMMASATPSFVETANSAAAGATDAKLQQSIIAESKAVIRETVAVVSAARDAVAAGKAETPELASAQQKYGAAAGRLLNVLQPGKKEINQATQMVLEALQRMRDGTAPEGGMSISDVNQAISDLTAQIPKLTTSAKNSPLQVGTNAIETASAIVAIIDGSRSLAHGGTGAPTAEITSPCGAILRECQAMDANQSAAQVVASARQVAALTVTLVTASKKQAANQPDANKKQDLIKGAQMIATGTQKLAGLAKAGAQKQPVDANEVLQISAQLRQAAQLMVAAAPVIRGGAVNQAAAQKLLSTTADVANAGTILIGSAGTVAQKPDDGMSNTQMSMSSQTANDCVNQLIKAVAELQPGVRECDEAVAAIAAVITDLDSSLLGVAVDSFDYQPPAGVTLQDAQEDAVSQVSDLTAAIQKVVAARADPQALALEVQVVAGTVRLLGTNAKNAAATSQSQKVSLDMLRLSKDLAAAMQTLVHSAKESSLAPNDAKRQQAVVANSKAASQAVKNMLESLKDTVVFYRDLDDAMSAVQSAMAGLDQGLPQPTKNYRQAKADTGKAARDLAVSSGNLAMASRANLEGVGPAGRDVAAAVPKMIAATRTAAAVVADTRARAALIGAAKNLGMASYRSIEAAKALASDQKNPAFQQAMGKANDQVAQCVGALQDALNKAATGEQDMEKAQTMTSQAVSDLDAAGLFAAANQLDEVVGALPANATLSNVEAAAKQALEAIVANSARVAQNATTNTDALGKDAMAVGEAVKELADRIKEVAMLLPDMLIQQDLIGGAKVVAVRAQTMLASGVMAANAGDSPATKDLLSQSLEDVQTYAASLLKQMESAADEAGRGIRELEKAQKQIKMGLAEFDSQNPPKMQSVTNDDVINAARAISAANAHIMSAASLGQEELAKAAREAGEGSVMLLEVTKSSAKLADKPETRKKMADAAKATANATGQLMEFTKAAQLGTKDKVKAQQAASAASSKVVDCINDYVLAARELPGAAKLSLQEDFGEDLDELAEKELRAAAKAIEDAAKSLLNAQPRTREENLAIGWDENEISSAILDAAKAIAFATSTLVKAAAQAQKERVAAGRDAKTKHLYKRDPVWSNGLISAAKNVAANTELLVHTANASAKGEDAGDEDHLVAAAKGVASSTAQLVAASKAKADPLSHTQKTLSDAAKSVAKATSELVNAAKIASQREREAAEAAQASKSSGLHQGKIAEMEQQALILKLERQLAIERKKLADMRKFEYQNPYEVK